MIKKLALGFAVLIPLAVVYIAIFGFGSLGEHEQPGVIQGEGLPNELRAAQDKNQSEAALAVNANADKQILFGDFHVHTTFSYDAFTQNLPLRGGAGSRPPADACDFARYCSNLDFWSINDHAEELTPRHWSETVESIRDCNAKSVDSSNPDMVSFLGWEWTQMGSNPGNHYGHKNVVLGGIDDGEIPRRPIAALRPVTGIAQPEDWQLGMMAIKHWDRRFLDWSHYLMESNDVPACDTVTPLQSWPSNCREWAVTPADLYAKLNEWNVDSVVIPHGTTWGIYTPPTSNWRKQIEGHDPSIERLVEIYSGHGNTEEYFSNDAAFYDASGKAYCPEPTQGYEPSCYRAGEIIRQRCLLANGDEADCNDRAAVARQNYAEAGNGGHLTIPDATSDDWLAAGQYTDGFLPAFNYRAASSVQAILATRNDQGKGFELGFISSSDNHTGRPGTGYKEYGMGLMTEGRKSHTPGRFTGLKTGEQEPAPLLLESKKITPDDFIAAGASAFEAERAGSFFYTGGLVAVHAPRRDRQSIWNGVKTKETYATSGPRILLWFDLLDEQGSSAAPMGASVDRQQAPRFRVKAVGSYKQKPGCPDYASEGLGADRLADLCRGQCYFPGDERKLISRIEVVRIRPQSHSEEPLSELIESPWRVYQCTDNVDGCEVEFEDEEYDIAARDTLYYVRAIEEPSEAVNGANQGCEFNEQGQCIAVKECGARGGQGEDCLAPIEERAWSSPIFLHYGKANASG